MSPVRDPAALAGVDVRGADGGMVGRVRDVYLADRTGELRALTVTRGRWSTATVLVPVAAVDLATLDAAVRDAADGEGGDGGADGSSAEGGTDGVGRSDGRSSGSGRREHSRPVRLLVTAAAARGGLPPDDTGHADPELLERAARALTAPADEDGPGPTPAAG